MEQKGVIISTFLSKIKQPRANKTKENKYKPLNIFFFFEKKSDELMEIKEIISSMTDKFIIKGEFNKPSLLNELSYYFGISDIVRGKINKKETQNLILCYSSFDNSKALLFDFIDKFKEGIVNMMITLFLYF